MHRLVKLAKQLWSTSAVYRTSRILAVLGLLIITLVVGLNLKNRVTGKQFLTAVEGGDLGRVRLLLKGNPELVFMKDRDPSPLLNGKTCLHLAVFGDRKEMVELLLASNANVNALDHFGKTPLHYATFGGDKAIVELLLTNGSNVNAKDDFGGTPLQIAAQQSDKSMADLLRQYGGHD